MSVGIRVVMISGIHPYFARQATEPISRIVSADSSYRLQWKRRFPVESGVVPVGTSDESSTLWLMAYAGPGMPDQFLVKIDADGQSLIKYYPEIPHARDEWLTHFSLASTS